MEIDIRPLFFRLFPALPIVWLFLASPLRAQDLRPDARITETNKYSNKWLHRGELVSPPGWFGPGPGWGGWRGYGPGVGWTYYNTPGGPYTTWGPYWGPWWWYDPAFAVQMGTGFVSGPGGAPYGMGVGAYGYNSYGWGYGFGFPAATGGFWTNGLSLYGPPIPTYGPVPGVFGGSQAQKTYFMQNVYGSGMMGHDWFAYKKFGMPPGWQRFHPPGGYECARVSVHPEAPASFPLVAVPPSSPKCARLVLRMPSPDAEVWIGTAKLTTTGAEREYESPELDEGKAYGYELIVRWVEKGEPKARMRKVTVKAGQSVPVDFTVEAE